MTTPCLKIGPLPDRAPVKIAIAVDPAIAKDLEIYASLYEETYKEKVTLAALIPSMLEAFLAGDQGFKKARKARASRTISSS